MEVRTRFCCCFTCVLWKGYLDKRRHRRCEDARTTEHIGTRVRLLRSLNADPSLPDDLNISVQPALSMFDEDIPKEERVKYVVAEEWRRKMARDWSPKLPIGGLVPFFEKEPELAATGDWTSFVLFAAC